MVVLAIAIVEHDHNPEHERCGDNDGNDNGTNDDQYDHEHDHPDYDHYHDHCHDHGHDHGNNRTLHSICLSIVGNVSETRGRNTS